MQERLSLALFEACPPFLERKPTPASSGVSAALSFSAAPGFSAGASASFGASAFGSFAAGAKEDLKTQRGPKDK